jgi:plastocyanin
MGVAAVLASAFLGACGGDDDKEDPTGAKLSTEPVSVEVTASEYKFELSRPSLVGGTFDVRMNNVGKEAHIAVVTKIAAGKTIADVQKGDPAALEMVAGVASVDPGGTGNATFKLAQGSYILGCFIPAPDGQPHIAKGMALPFSVVADGASKVQKLPEADVKVEGKDFSYDEKPSFKAGETTVQFTNKGTQDHEITVIELDPGKTVDDVGAFFAKPSGPPPFKLQGGVAVKVGDTGTTTVTFKKGGNYLFACLIPDQADGQPHIAKGMATKVTVT